MTGTNDAPAAALLRLAARSAEILRPTAEVVPFGGVPVLPYSAVVRGVGAVAASAFEVKELGRLGELLADCSAATTRFMLSMLIAARYKQEQRERLRVNVQQLQHSLSTRWSWVGEHKLVYHLSGQRPKLDWSSSVDQLTDPSSYFNVVSVRNRPSSESCTVDTTSRLSRSCRDFQHLYARRYLLKQKLADQQNSGSQRAEAPVRSCPKAPPACRAMQRMWPGVPGTTRGARKMRWRMRCGAAAP